MHFHVAWYITDLMACKTHSGNKLLNLYDIQIQSVSESQFIDFEGAPKQKQRLDKWQSQKNCILNSRLSFYLIIPILVLHAVIFLQFQHSIKSRNRCYRLLKKNENILLKPCWHRTQSTLCIIQLKTHLFILTIHDFFFLLKPLGDWSEYRVICQWLRYPILDMLIWQV